MPLSLTIQAAPRRRSSKTQAWRLLHEEADRLYPQLRTTWATLFADMQAALPEAALREALATGNALAVEAVLIPVWQQAGVMQAQTLLPALIQAAVARTAEALLPGTKRALGVTIDIAFNVVVPETLAAIDAFIGTQITGISDVTLQSVRQVIRQGFVEGRSVTQLMRDLEGFIGLTPRQTQAIEALRDRLTAQGLSRAAVQVQVDAAARKALRLRVESISRTESITASNLGQQQLWRQSVAQGLLDEQRFRRFWRVTRDRRLCPICEAIPGMNPDGVGLNTPFQTPVGEVMYPTAHTHCRCAVDGRVTT